MKRYVLAAALLLASSLPARASVVTYQFLGTVTQADAVLPTYMPGIEVNDPFSLFITFEDSLEFQNPLIIGFNTSTYQMFVGDFRIHGPNDFAPRLNPVSWRALDIRVDGPWARVPQFQGDFLEIFNSQLVFYNLDLFACPPGTPGTCDDTPGFVGTVNTVTNVPDASSTALLLTLGMGAIVRLRRRRQ